MIVVVRCSVEGHRQEVGTIELGTEVVMVRKAPIMGVQTGDKPLWLNRRTRLALDEFWDESDTIIEFYCPRHGVLGRALADLQRDLRSAM